MSEQIYTFNLPDIGEGVVEGEVVEWLKKVGDPVKQDEPVVVVMTDKATVELSAPYPGTIAKHYFNPGEISIKDKPLFDIRIEAGSPQIIKRAKFEPEKSKVQDKKPSSALPKIDKPSLAVHSKALAVPKVRQLAKELGVDIDSVAPTGKHGDVTLEDLKKASCPKATEVLLKSLEGDIEQPLIGIRGLMARKMDQIHIPQFSYFEEVEATRLVQLREHSKVIASKQGLKLSFMPFFIRALVLTAKEYPQLNSSIDVPRNTMIVHKQMNLGVAMASSQGLIVPVLKGVQDMKLQEIADAYVELQQKAKDNKLHSSDMKDATLTLSNFGSLGEGRWATPMISPPEAAILAVARIMPAPIVKKGELVVRDVLNLSWSFDHRIIDGELAAKISNHFCRLIRDPLPLI